MRQAIRHIKATVGSQPFGYRLFQPCGVLIIIGAVIEHNQSMMTVPGAAGLNVFFTQTGICFIATGAIVGG